MSRQAQHNFKSSLSLSIVKFYREFFKHKRNILYSKVITKEYTRQQIKHRNGIIQRTGGDKFHVYKELKR